MTTNPDGKNVWAAIVRATNPQTLLDWDAYQAAGRAALATVRWEADGE